MKFLEKRKSRRVWGAELVVTGGVTLFLSYVGSWLAPLGLCLYGGYRWFLKKSYKDGVVSLALGILLLVLLNGPLKGVLGILYGVGGLILLVGAIMMILPNKSTDDDQK